MGSLETWADWGEILNNETLPAVNSNEVFIGITLFA
jgi:hypothetical protein